MSTLLKIDVSPRGDYSISRKLGNHFATEWQSNHVGGEIITRDLATTKIPYVDLPWIAEEVELRIEPPHCLHALLEHARPALRVGEVLLVVGQRADHLEAVARTFAFFHGDTIITPDHVKAVAPHVLAHRLVLRDGMEFSVSREEILDEVIRLMDVPPWT